MKQPWSHLHGHSHYSLRDGLGTVSEIVETAAGLGFESICLTDHGTASGWFDLDQATKKKGIKPLFGCELYVTDNRLRHGVTDAEEEEFKAKHGKKMNKDEKAALNKERGSSYHLVAHAMNAQGVKNLNHIITDANVNGFYRQPRTDWEFLRQHNEGVFVSTACLGGVLAKPLIRKVGESRELMPDEVTFQRHLELLQSIFPGRFALEIQPNDMEDQRAVNQRLVQVARKIGVPFVLTQDFHYPKIEDFTAHEHVKMMCFDIKAKDWQAFSKYHYYLCDYNGIWASWCKYGHNDLLGPDVFAEACANTKQIESMLNPEIDYQSKKVPKFPVPDGFSTSEQFFDSLVIEGWNRRYYQMGRGPYHHDRDRYWSQLQHEIKIVKDMGFIDYFLIVQDFVMHAKRQGWAVGPARGSAGGCMLSWIMGITEIDPLRFRLVFERFLNPERVKMPDIDSDFSDIDRHKVKAYLLEKWGAENCASIVAYNRYSSKGVLNDIGKVYDVNYKETSDVTKQMDTEASVSEEMKSNQKLHDYMSKNKLIPLVPVIERLSGMIRHTTVAAAGMLISDQPISNLTTLQRKGGEGGDIVTEIEGDKLGDAGFLKMDVLGIRELSSLKLTCEAIGKNLDWLYEEVAAEMNDPLVWERFKQGDTLAVFQFGSEGMKRLLRNVRPDGIMELAAVSALYRPQTLMSGVADSYWKRKHGQEEINSINPLVDPIFKDTYGLCLRRGTLVQTDKGLETIESLTGDREIFGKSGTTITAGRFGSVMSSGFKRVWRVSSEGCFDEFASGDHKWLTQRGWVETKELCQDDFLAVARTVRRSPKTCDAIDDSVAYLLGLLIADGCYIKTSGVYITCGLDEVGQLMPKIQQAAGKFGDRVDVMLLDRCARLYFRPMHKTKYHQPSGVASWLMRIGIIGQAGTGKKMPSCVWNWNKDSVRSLLAGLWDGDGSKQQSVYTTISESLAREIVVLLQMHGIASYVRDVDGAWKLYLTSDENYLESVIGNLMQCDHQFQRCQIERVPQEVVDVIVEKIKCLGLSRRHLDRIGVVNRQVGRRDGRGCEIRESTVEKAIELFGQPTDYVWRKVIKIVDTGIDDEMFDILDSSCDSSFVLTHHLVHNCVFQEQFIAAFEKLGLTYGEADIMRRAYEDVVKVHKRAKAQEKIDQYMEKLKVVGKLPPEELDRVATILGGEVGYSFNVAHSVAYSMLAYFGQYLKVHHEKEYWISVMNTEMNHTKNGQKTQMDPYINKLDKMYRERGATLQIYAGSINSFSKHFKIIDDAAGTPWLFYGLEAVSGIGENTVDALLDYVQSHKRPFASIKEFFEHKDGKFDKGITSAHLNTLIEIGMFDNLPLSPEYPYAMNRAQLVTWHGLWQEIKTSKAKRQAMYQPGKVAVKRAVGKGKESVEVFADTIDTSVKCEITDVQAYEMNHLGTIITNNVMRRYANEAEYMRAALESNPKMADKVLICGMLVDATQDPEKGKTELIVHTIDQGKMSVTVWEKKFKKQNLELNIGQVYALICNQKGKWLDLERLVTLTAERPVYN